MQQTNPVLKIKYRKIPSLKFLYEISKDGKIRNIKSKKHLSIRINKKGYNEVTVKNFNVKAVHRLVAEVWVKNSKHPYLSITELVVNHKDFNKLNNNADNLEWLTQKENIDYDWENGHRDHLREKLAERCKQTFTGRLVTAENTERCKLMATCEQERRKELDICYGGHVCFLITPNGLKLEFKSISRAAKFIAEHDGVKMSSIYRNLHKRHYSHGYKLCI